jgi:site-specific recombinase XerD
MIPWRPWSGRCASSRAATDLLDARADLRFVQDWIGHASIKNTVIYAQLTSRKRDAEARRVFTSPYVV